MRKHIPIVLLALALSPLGAQADGHTSAVFSTPPTVDHLPNGLTLVTLPAESPGIVAYYTLMRVGSRDEVEAGHSGYAHLFEHMMFRGTQDVPQEEYERRIQSFGADNNAYTTRDFTLYTVTSPKASLAEVVALEADRFQHLSYAEDAYRTETGAVAGEYAKNASNPFMRMWETLSEMAFTRHTYGHTTMGYLRDVCAMPGEVAYSREFFRRFYTPDNATIIVAGDVDHDRVLALVREQYGSWRGRRARTRVRPEPEPRRGARRDLSWSGTTPPRLFIAYRVPAFEGDGSARRRARTLRQTAALQVVHGLVFGDSSPLHRRLVVDEQKVLELSSWADEFNRDPGLFVVTSTLKPSTSFDEVIAPTQAAIDRVAAGELPAARIDAVRSHIRYSMLMHLDTPSNMADRVAQMIAVGGDPGALDRYLAALSAVTPDDVRDAARSFLTERRRFIVTLAPGQGDAQPAGASLCPAETPEAAAASSTSGEAQPAAGSEGGAQ
ncbi:MAG: insulinase family protein [Deltaproteobacteria bacterium]|nr:insulinase family protein [Deltaproteobacteria bacterium]